MSMHPPRQSLTRVFCLLAAPTLLLSIAATPVGEQVDRGAATPGAFGLLIAVYSLFLGPLGNRLEAMVLGGEQRPWLGGQLRRWQKLILPYSTGRTLTVGIGLGFGGGAYLLSAPPGGSALNVLAVFLCASGSALLGFGLSRLAVGLCIIRYSGLWAASRRAWLVGGSAVAVGSLAFSAHSIVTTMRLSPVL